MKKIISLIIVFCLGIMMFQCKSILEPIPSDQTVGGITETGNNPTDYLGSIDLTDWDPSFYQHLTIRENFWIDRALTDTISASANYNNPVKIHNLSQSDLCIKIIVSSPFMCSQDSITILSDQTATVNISIDTNAVGQDTLKYDHIIFTIAGNDQLQFVLGWRKPSHSGGVVEVSIIPPRNLLFPAYPNPADGYIILEFSLKEKQFAILRVLDYTLRPMDTLLQNVFNAGMHSYRWLSTKEERNKYPSGLYRIVFETDHYTRFGDILLQK
jgi:hypothetical protein